MRAIVYAHLTCKLAWLSHPEAIKGPKRLEGSADDGPRAVRVELDRVLAGEGIGPRKPQDEHLVYELAARKRDVIVIGRRPHLPKHSLARRGHATTPTGHHVGEDVPCTRA